MQMEYNPEQTAMQDEVEEMAASLQRMELTTPSKPTCCIYKVPEHIKKGKDELYRPSVISIGPVFRNDGKRLEAMQELKRICLKKFREHPGNALQSLKPCIKFVKDHERKIRDSYDWQIDLPLASDDFVKMIALDAVFLIYYFLFQNSSDSLEAGNSLRVLRNRLDRDLVLEENQIPFFVLKGIYNTTFSEDYRRRCRSFTYLALNCIRSLSVQIPGFKAIDSIYSNGAITDATTIQHLVDLQRMSCCLHTENQIGHERTKGITYYVIQCLVYLLGMCCCWQKESERERLIYKFDSAKKLSDAGVKFELSQSNFLMNITFDKNKGVLKIPKLTLEDYTEPTLRSILVFEQCHYASQKKFTDYIIFFDTLVDTVEDIQVLQKNAIVDNILGSDEEAVDLFNKLAKNMTAGRFFSFSDVSKGLQEYASNPWNRWKAIFWSKYFNHPWTIISVIAAMILFILTLLQTITGFLQLK